MHQVDQVVLDDHRGVLGDALVEVDGDTVRGLDHVGDPEPVVRDVELQLERRVHQIHDRDLGAEGDLVGQHRADLPDAQRPDGLTEGLVPAAGGQDQLLDGGVVQGWEKVRFCRHAASMGAAERGSLLPIEQTGRVPFWRVGAAGGCAEQTSTPRRQP